MPSWADYKKQATERGSLAYELFVVESTPAKSPEDLKKRLPDHLAYQQTQELSGALAFAGPMSDLTGELMQGAGLIVYRAESFDAAKKLADDDPMHSTGTRTYTLRRWLINEGSFQLDVKLSSQRVRFEQKT